MANSSPKLLVVDDLVDWQKTLSGVLADKGYHVSSAGSMEDAIALLEHGEYDLALLDLRLDEADEGNEDGLILAKAIRNRWPKIRILIVTGYGTTDVLQRSMAPDSEGKRLVEDYLEKGNTDKLVETVKRVLSN
jgi:CheY-like chemotaxis protein